MRFHPYFGKYRKPFFPIKILKYGIVPERTQNQFVQGKNFALYSEINYSTEDHLCCFRYDLANYIALWPTNFRRQVEHYLLVNRVDHQEHNQMTPYGAIWLMFWC